MAYSLQPSLIVNGFRATDLLAARGLRMTGAALCMLVFLHLGSTVARAAEPTVGVEYVAPADCPRPAEFIALVSGRSQGPWRFRLGDGDLRFAVEIRDDAGGKVGQVRRTTTRGASEPRQIQGRDCREVVQALALTTALSLETIDEAPADSPVAVATERAPLASPRTWAIGLGLSAVVLLPPNPMAEAVLFVESQDPRWPAGVALHRPDLRLSFAHARNDLFAAPEKAAFALSTVAVAACPIGWSMLRLCGTGELGVLAGRGLDVENPQSSHSFWVAAGALGRARWAFRALVIEVQASVRMPLRHTAFVFERPWRPVADVPSVIVGSGLALGVPIP